MTNFTSSHALLLAARRLAKETGCTLTEKRETIMAPHFKFPQRIHRYIFETVLGTRAEFRICSARLPINLKSPKGREMIHWLRDCRQIANREYA